VLPLRTPRVTGAERPRRLALAVAIAIGVPLALVMLAASVLAALAITGTPIDLSRWRDAAAQQASAALGRPVILQGPLQLELRPGRELGVRVGALRVLNPPGFTQQPLIAVGELRVQVDVIDALRGRFRSSSIVARDVDVWLKRGADGVGNWTAAPRTEAPARPMPIDIATIALHEVNLHYSDARDNTHRSIRLDQVTAYVGADTPLRVAARGRLGQGLAYTVGIEGGVLRLLDEGSAWPLTVDLDIAGARLRASGTVNAAERSARLQVDAKSEKLAALEPLLGATLAELRNASLQCLLDIGQQAVQVTNLRGRLGESEFAGQLLLSFAAARARLGGAVNVSTLDLRPFLAAPPSSLDDAGPPDLELRRLVALDADVELTVERWLGLDVEVRDAQLAWRAEARGVHVPMRATLNGLPLSGGLEVDTAVPTPTVTFRLGADDATLGSKTPGAGAVAGLQGTVGRARLRLHGRGDTVAAVSRDFDLSLALTAARLRWVDPQRAEPIAVSIDQLDLAAVSGARLTGHARGRVQQQPATLRVRGGTVPQLLVEHLLPLELDLTWAQSRLQMAGSVALPGSTDDTALRIDFHAPRAGDLSPWLKVAPQSLLPVAARGRLRQSGPVWTLDQGTLEIGRSQLAVDVRSSVTAGRRSTAAAVRGKLIDATQLSSLFASLDDVQPDKRSKVPSGSSALDVHDIDLDVKLQQLQLGRADLQDLAFNVRLRDGRVDPVPVTGRIAGTAFDAQVDMDLQAQPAAASLALSTGVIDIGALLRGLGVAKDVDGRVRSLQVNLRGQGSNAGEWLDQSALELQFNGGELAVPGVVKGTRSALRLDQARIGAKAGEPLRALVEGAIDQRPVRIEVATGTLAQLAGQAGRLPFSLSAVAADTQFGLEGELPVPLGRDGDLILQMRGERLDSLSPLARVELPPWGPWSFSSPLQVTADGFTLPQLTAKVGQSQFGGSAALGLRGLRPQLDMQIVTPSIQLDDFPLPQRLAGAASPPQEDRTARQVIARAVEQTDTLLSAAFLHTVDANIDVKAGQVLSGNDRLGDGALRLTLVEGHLDVDPVVINVPGGAVRLSMSYDLKGSEVELGIAAKVERFEYGVLARRLGRTDGLSGLFSLNMAFFGRAPSLDRIMHKANGRMDFAVWPNELRSGAFNLWSVNLLVQLLPLIDPGNQAAVNCVVGRFDLDNGVLTDDMMVIDTSAVRIRGNGQINFATQDLAFSFRPRAKGFDLFRLQTPLHVTGKLGDQRFGISQFELATSVLRAAASPVLVPIERWRLGPLPRDGADVCTDPLRAATPL
jgi:AsmA family protein